MLACGPVNLELPRGKVITLPIAALSPTNKRTLNDEFAWDAWRVRASDIRQGRLTHEDVARIEASIYSAPRQKVTARPESS